MASASELALLDLATRLSTSADRRPTEELKPLSQEDIAFLQGAMEQYEAGASSKRIREALGKLFRYLEREEDEEDEEKREEEEDELVEALDYLQEEFEDLNRTQILLHIESGALEALFFLMDQRIKLDREEEGAVSAKVAENRSKLRRLADIPARIRRAALATLAAAIRSHPPMQDLVHRYQFFQRLALFFDAFHEEKVKLEELFFSTIAQSTTTTTETTAQNDDDDEDEDKDVLDQIPSSLAKKMKETGDWMIQVVGGYSAYVINHPEHEQQVVAGTIGRDIGRQLIGWVGSPVGGPRLWSKIVFLLRNLLRRYGQAYLPLLLADGELPLALWCKLLLAPRSCRHLTAGQSTTVLAELLASFLEELLTVAQPQIAPLLLRACPSFIDDVRARLTWLTQSDPDHDYQSETESLQAILKMIASS